MAPKHLDEWAGSVHARAGVNCRDCHAPAQAGGTHAAWQEKPGAACNTCHEREQQGFEAGRHGMRLAQKLPPMRPELARQPMQPDAHGRELGCSSCHDAHAVNVRRAAVESCVECHDDQHSRAYVDSPHARLWRAEQAGHAAAGSGVSCATCHLPRELHRDGDLKGIRVQHNQNANLRPNEKMIRGVCMNCHGLGFSIDALADPVLIQWNFAGQPTAHVESLDLAATRLKQPRKPKP
jgi:formate-dependent nitrite reductase cytochrome c552 subunit